MSGSPSMPGALHALPAAPFVTFYSFKGGVGRSMALFNVAGILAGRGFRVLVIDFDLEAPGLSYLLRDQAPEAAARPGLVELLESAVREGDAGDMFRCTPGEVVAAYTHPYALPPALIHDPDGELRVLPAGRLDDDYPRRLDELDLPGLYRGGRGQPLMGAFKQIIGDAGHFDLVLVDSRAGFSDESGICTRDLADLVVVVTGLNHQNIAGTAAFLRGLHAATGGERDPLFVLSPVPMGEDELMELREAAAQDAFAAAWRRPVDLSARIYHHPRLALTEEPHVFRGSRSPLHEAYSALALRLRTSVGLLDRVLYDEVCAAIRGHQFARALERSRVLVELDGGESLDRLIWSHSGHFRATQESDSLLDFLIDHLPQSANLDAVGGAIHDHPLVGRVYERALARAPNDASALGNVAFFLERVRKDFDAAEALYRRAIAADPLHGENLGFFAYFLQTVRKDHEGAEAYYRRALEAEPGDEHNLCNLAQLVLARGQYDEGRDYLEQALAVLSPDDPSPLCELYFYAYAHGNGRWPDALGSLKRLLTGGARSPGWDLQANLQRVRQDGHPEAALVAALAEVIVNDAPLATLAGFEAWQRAA